MKRRILENKFQAELHGAASAGADYRIRGGYVRCRAGAAETAGARNRRIVVPPAVLAAERVGKIRMVEDIEEFRAELHVEAFTEAEHLHGGEVHIPKPEIPEGVATHGAERTRSGRSHYRLSFRVAAPVRELVSSRLATRVRDARRSGGGRPRRHSDHVSARVGNEIGVGDPRDAGGLCGFKVRRTPGEIPAIHALTGVAQICPGVDDAPGLRTKQADD